MLFSSLKLKFLLDYFSFSIVCHEGTLVQLGSGEAYDVVSALFAEDFAASYRSSCCQSRSVSDVWMLSV